MNAATLIKENINDVKDEDSNIYVELKNVNKNFGDFKASDNVSFKVKRTSGRSSWTERQR